MSLDPRSVTNLKSAFGFEFSPMPRYDSDPSKRSILVVYGCGFNSPAFASTLDLYWEFAISPPLYDLKLSTKKPHLNLSNFVVSSLIVKFWVSDSSKDKEV